MYRDGIINWIEAWLTDRQRIVVDVEISFEWGITRINIRVFIILNIYIYIDDLNDDITSKVLKCADATEVFKKVNNICKTI